ncbi:MAG TPA: peroxide stress protein YaaA [Thermoplasmata archaeon]
MARIETLVLIPESTRKAKGGTAEGAVDAVAKALPADAKAKLATLREEVRSKAPAGAVDGTAFLPAHLRFQGNMYRHIPQEAWEDRRPGVEVLIVSGFYGLIASRDPVVRYEASMAEPFSTLGKLNRWWHDCGLPEILQAYLKAVHPRSLVDLLSLEYREAVLGYAESLPGMSVKTVDFPGLGRGSQPRRGEKVAEILRAGQP